MGNSEFKPTRGECVAVRRLARKAERAARLAADPDMSWIRKGAFETLAEQYAFEAQALAIRVMHRGIAS